MTGETVSRAWAPMQTNQDRTSHRTASKAVLHQEGTRGQMGAPCRTCSFLPSEWSEKIKRERERATLPLADTLRGVAGRSSPHRRVSLCRETRSTVPSPLFLSLMMALAERGEDPVRTGEEIVTSPPSAVIPSPFPGEELGMYGGGGVKI